jgi:hypothetical protein
MTDILDISKDDLGWLVLAMYLAWIVVYHNVGSSPDKKQEKK